MQNFNQRQKDRQEHVFSNSRPVFIANKRNAVSNHTTIHDKSTSILSGNSFKGVNQRLEDLSRERLDDKRAREAIYELNGIIDKMTLGDHISRKGTPTFSISRSM